MSLSETLKGRLSIVHTLLGLLIFLFFLLFIHPDPERPEVGRTLAVAVLMAYWWITQAIPLAATALIPVVLFPVLGVLDGTTVSALYFNHLIFLFLGGFLMALAMEKWNLHRRIALRILLFTGVSPSRLLLGFMAATFFLSMWMSNTATAMLMVPIAISTMSKLGDSLGEKALGRFPVALMLGIAYSASVGGVATLVGTPPNLSFARISKILFPGMPEISFADWMIFALPLSMTVFFIVWGLLMLLFRPGAKWKGLSRDTFRVEYAGLGKMSYEERWVLVLFSLLALSWIFRADIDFGGFRLPGWSGIFAHSSFLNDGTVAIFFGLLLFIIPSSAGKGRLIDWSTASRLPWHIVLLFGGGFALAQGFVNSGLSLWLGESLQVLGGIHPFMLVLCLVLMMTFLTELTSNTATTEMILPVVAGLSISLQVNPLLLMLPATVAASMAFMLPVATPPNAIAFSTNQIQVKDMARAGLILNLVTSLLIAAMAWYWAPLVFGFDVAVFPDWAVGGR
jgi:solute carrier family 13 (sodium-dependent dicarboxylate transporter), member 2/3/5